MRLKLGILGAALTLLTGTVAMVPPPANAQSAPTIASEAAKRKVKTRITPEYPALARQMGVTGKVKVLTSISADGRVVGTKVVGGNPVLANAALEALKRWRFEAAPKETEEVIEFEFTGQS